MNNKRSYIYFLLCFLLTVTFCGKFNFVQAATYDDKGIKLEVNNNKAWVIKFNKELDNNTIDDSKFIVTDEGEQQVPVKVTLGADGKSVVVSPKIQYSYGKTYNLFIKDGIKSKSKNGLTKTAKMQFTIKNNIVNDANKAYTVCIDAGHGGSDTGSVGQAGIKEKDIDLSVALKIGKILEDSGVKVVYTRKGDSITWNKDDDLKSRFNIANNAKADFFVSIHCNTFPDNPSVNGIETYYLESDSVGQKLAQSVQSEIVSNTGLVDRKIKVGLPQHEILRGTSATAIMVELGFLTNPQEEKVIASEDFQNKSSAAIANGILSSLKLVDKNSNVTISSISDLSMSAAQDTAFTLPLTVTANMNNGTSKKVNVIWKDKTVNTSELGVYSYKGNVAGYSKDITLNLAVVDKVNTPTPPTPDNSKVIVLDPGHGIGKDTGATGVTGVQEDDVTLKVVLKVGKILEEHGVQVIYTRTTDERSTPMSVVESLQRRCDTANNANARYFVSVHNNSADIPNANGTETLYFTGNNEGEKLARAIQANLVNQLGSYDRGLKDGCWLYIAKNTTAPTVLTELGFLSNTNEEKKLNSDDYQTKCAEAIAKGILDCLGM